MLMRPRNVIMDTGDESIETSRELTELSGKMTDAQNEAKGYKEKLDELNTGLSEAESAWAGYNAVIQNYEGLSAAVVSGDQEKISEALSYLTNDFQTSATGTRDSLQEQVDTLTEKYEAMRDAVKAGAQQNRRPEIRCRQS